MAFFHGYVLFPECITCFLSNVFGEIIPTDRLIFFRGIKQSPTRCRHSSFKFFFFLFLSMKKWNQGWFGMFLHVSTWFFIFIIYPVVNGGNDSELGVFIFPTPSLWTTGSRPSARNWISPEHLMGETGELEAMEIVDVHHDLQWLYFYNNAKKTLYNSVLMYINVH